MWTSNFTFMTKLFHISEKISHEIKCMLKSSHVWQKSFTCITKFHMHVKKFTCMWNADVVNLYFCQHWFHMVPFFHTLFTPFSHDFHTHSPSSELAAARSSLIITSLLKPPVLGQGLKCKGVNARVAIVNSSLIDSWFWYGTNRCINKAETVFQGGTFVMNCFRVSLQ